MDASERPDLATDGTAPGAGTGDGTDRATTAGWGTAMATGTTTGGTTVRRRLQLRLLGDLGQLGIQPVVQERAVLRLVVVAPVVAAALATGLVVLQPLLVGSVRLLLVRPARDRRGRAGARGRCGPRRAAGAGRGPRGEAVVQAPQAPDPAQQAELNRAANHYLSVGDAFREGRFDDAARAYSRAVEFAPELGILRLVLSDSLFAIGDYRRAAAELRKALELDPSLALHAVDKRAFYGDPADFDRHIALLERYLEDHFLDADARLLLAGNYLFGGRPAAAVDLLESPFSSEVVETEPGAVPGGFAPRAVRSRGAPAGR